MILVQKACGADPRHALLVDKLRLQVQVDVTDAAGNRTRGRSLLAL